LALAQSVPEVPADPVKPAEQCEAADGEIVVCGSRKANDRYRLRPIANAPTETGPPKAEIALAEGVTVSVGTGSSGNPSAGNVPAFMLRLKIKF